MYITGRRGYANSFQTCVQLLKVAPTTQGRSQWGAGGQKKRKRKEGERREKGRKREKEEKRKRNNRERERGGKERKREETGNKHHFKINMNINNDMTFA